MRRRRPEGFEPPTVAKTINLRLSLNRQLGWRFFFIRACPLLCRVGAGFHPAGPALDLRQDNKPATR
jgi:hypothetical protein